MAYCGKCLHLDVCKTADSCCGSVPKCKHFIEKGILIAGSDGVRNGTQAVPYGGGGRNGTQAVPYTRADQIRAMTDEQLAEGLYQVSYKTEDVGKLFCDAKAGCITTDGDILCDEDKIRACIMRWLRQPVEGTP